MLIKPVLLYMPPQKATTPFLAAPLRLTVMLQQGDSGWLLHMRLSSSSKFPLLLNCHPLYGGSLGWSPIGAFNRASFPSSPASHSAPDLDETERRGGLFLPVQQQLFLCSNLYGVRLSVDWRTLLVFARHKIKPTKGLTHMVATDSQARQHQFCNFIFCIWLLILSLM